jgi:hypothetical protein
MQPAQGSRGVLAPWAAGRISIDRARNQRPGQAQIASFNFPNSLICTNGSSTRGRTNAGLATARLAAMNNSTGWPDPHVIRNDDDASRALPRRSALERKLRDKNPRFALADFPVARPSGNKSYLVSVRPLPVGRRAGRAETAIAIIVFVHDRAKGNVAATSILREVLGLTEAEADLAPRCNPQFR